MAGIPKLYEIFSSFFLATALLVGSYITVTRERALRRDFAAFHGFGMLEHF